jgi:hypothetical protein
VTSPLTFRVSTRISGRRRTVTVTVYDDVDQLRAAGRAYVRRHRTNQDDHFARALGITHTSETISFDGEGAPRRRGTAAGIVRLARPHLGTSVVVHEAVHAACGIYRQDHQAGHGHAEDDMDNEEVLAHLVGDLTRRIVDRLYHYGAYARPEEKSP